MNQQHGKITGVATVIRKNPAPTPTPTKQEKPDGSHTLKRGS
jgi:hypothetical protein